MTNRLSLIIGSIIIGLIVLDLVVWGGENLIFLARKLDEFIEYLAFWR